MTVHQTSIGAIELLDNGAGRDMLLLLHAAASGPRALFKLATALTAVSGWQARMPALHGYGASRLDDALPEEPFAAHVRIVRWAFDRAGIGGGRRILFGHSMGGLVALLGVLDGPRPDTLVLYEPIVLDCLDPADPADVGARAWDAACIATLHERCGAGAPEAGVAAFVEAFNEVAWDQLPVALRVDLVAKAANLVAETRAAAVLTLNKGAIAALSMPVLILQGERSPAVTHGMTAGLARAIPHARRTIVEGAGHMGPVLSHAAVAGAIASFLNEATPGT